MAWRTQTRTSTPSLSCRPSTPCRNSRCRRASIRPNSAAKPPRSTCSPNPARTSITAPCSSSSATTRWMPIPIPSLLSAPPRIPSSGTSMASRWAAPSAFRKSSTAKTSSSSWGTTSPTANAATPPACIPWRRSRCRAGTSPPSPPESTIPIPTPWRPTARPSPRHCSPEMYFRKTASAPSRKSCWSSIALRCCPA